MPIKTPAKRLLPFALILILAVPSFGQTLLFKTGFEPNTTLGGVATGSNAVPCTSYSTSASIFVDFSGTDSSTGQAWPMKPFSWGSNTGIRVDSANTGGTYCNNFVDKIITSGCHSGSQCLQQTTQNYPNSIGSPQQPIGETNLSGTPVTEFYERFWLKYDPSWQTSINNFAGYNADSVTYWKTADDYRVEPNIFTNNSWISGGNYTLRSQMKADPGGISSGCQFLNGITFQSMTDHCNYFGYVSNDNEEYNISIGTWHLIEYYFKRGGACANCAAGHSPDGRIAYAIDGHVVADNNVVTWGPSQENVQDFGFSQNYDAPYPETRYMDDWEIWSTIPCTTFPCQTVTGTGGGPVTTPVPETRFPSTSYNAVVCTAGDACSYQLSAIGANHFQADCSVPPGLSLNSSTGLISGTPSSSYNTGTSTYPNTYECQYELRNASGKDGQDMFFQIDATLHVPRIAYFWANGSTLNWIVLGSDTTHPTTLNINNGVGAVSGLNGSITVNPSTTTTYTLTATNGAGSTSATVLGNAATATVTVGSGNAPSPPYNLTGTVQ